MKKYKNLKYFILGLIVAGCIAAFAFMPRYEISAIQYNRDEQYYEFTVSKCSVSLHDNFTPHEFYTNGQIVTRDVYAVNNGTTDAYIRIKAVFESSDIADKVEVNWNTSDYVYRSEDNYYYLKEPVYAGQFSPDLFTQLIITQEVEEDFQPNMIIYVEAVQAEGASTYKEAWELVDAESDIWCD